MDKDWYDIAKKITNEQEIENNKNKIDKAFAIANNAIYFDDSSDYFTALYEVCIALNPNIRDEEIGRKYIKRCL